MGRRRKQLQTVGPLILQNFGFLRKIARTKSDKKLRKLLNGATRDQLLALVETSSNILKGFRLTQRQRQRLLPFAPTIRKLSRVRSERGARKIVQQTGGAVPVAVFASLLAPVLVEAAGHLISKIANRNDSGST